MLLAVWVGSGIVVPIDKSHFAPPLKNETQV